MKSEIREINCTMKQCLLVLNLTIINVFYCYSAPPFLTDDSEPVDFQHIEFYFASQSSIFNGSGNGTLPHFEINYGIIENVHFNFVIPIAYNYDRQNFNYGFSDLGFGIKYRFMEESNTSPQFCFYPFISFPTGNYENGLGNEKIQIYLPLWIQKSWNDWTTYGGAGYWINPGKGNNNWIFTGWLLQKQFSEVLTFGCELYYHSSNTVIDNESFCFNIGGFINLSPKSNIIFSFGHTFYGQNTSTVYLGYLLSL